MSPAQSRKQELAIKAASVTPKKKQHGISEYQRKRMLAGLRAYHRRRRMSLLSQDYYLVMAKVRGLETIDKLVNMEGVTLRHIRKA